MSSRPDFEGLVAAARDEQAPSVDVTEAVLARVAAGEARRDELPRPFVLAAGLSLTAAAVVLALALPWIEDLYDPMVQLLQATGGGWS